MPTDYKYRPMYNKWNNSPKPPKLVSGCIIPLVIVVIIVLIAYYLGK